MEHQDYQDELDRIRIRRQQRQKKAASPSSADDFQYYDDVDFVEPDSRGAAGTHSQKKRPAPAGREWERSGRSRTNARSPRRKRKRFHWKMPLFLVLCLFLGVSLFRYMRDDGYWTIAVFGVDSRDGTVGKGALSDVEMLCSIHKKTGEIRLVSVFRDSYLRIDSDDNYHKINEAYFKGGPSQAVEALETNLDLQIDDYATFNWKAVADAINVLGGVDLEITDREFAYINSFITETVNSTGIGSYQLEHSGQNHLDGVQAVAYARLRLMDTDFNRTERQRKVMSLAFEKAKSADFNTLKTLIGAVFPQVSTSIGVDDLIVIAKDAKKYYFGQTSGFPFSHTEMKIGSMDCVIPTTLESNVIQLHAFLYDDESYQPSGMVKKISSHIIEKTGLGEPGKDIESGRDNLTGQNAAPQTQAPAPDSQTAGTSPELPETLPENESSSENSDGSDSETSDDQSESETETILSPTEEERPDDPEEVGPGVGGPSNTTGAGANGTGSASSGTTGANSNGTDPDGPGTGGPGSSRPSGETDSGTPRETNGVLEAPGQNSDDTTGPAANNTGGPGNAPGANS